MEDNNTAYLESLREEFIPILRDAISVNQQLINYLEPRLRSGFLYEDLICTVRGYTNDLNATLEDALETVNE